MTGKPQQRGRPRTGARVAAVQALFQAEASGQPLEAVMAEFLRYRLQPVPGEGFEEGRIPEADPGLFVGILRKAATDPEGLDRIIAAHLAPNWPLERLDPVLRALLRAAAAELRDRPDPPARVVIREYLDIAHGFLAGEEPRFAAGVMDAMAHTLRADELAP
ncbi:MAG: transcription antitermination factor NusB [Rhodovarius sp.]|nr:transcription antitermination factor NusB [Rhodovarius sp.]MCX7931427.1 transcription antitermination factor NusB [Rhodovarius sp.]MDW8315042.1 transcription antitermination factor NusB [Rhodovarius sp.]